MAAPKLRLRPLFRVLHKVIASTQRALIEAPPPSHEDWRIFTFEIGIANRGLNGLRAVRLLCEEGHWENAAAAVRQIYELVVNMEHISSLPEREAAVSRYVKFGLLQEVQRRLLEVGYDRDTGRPVDEQTEAPLRRILAVGFPEFRSGSDAAPRFDRTWSGLTTKALAARSSNPIRRKQYEILFRFWSEEAHASPRALLEAVMPTSDLDFDAAVLSDDTRIAETVSVAVSLYIDLWMLLPSLPPLAEAWNWLDELLAIAQRFGATPAGDGRPRGVRPEGANPTTRQGDSDET